MSRPRHPSDDARLKHRPHVKIHLTVAVHPKTAAIWANLRKRAMLVELWRQAEEAYAGRRENQLVLTPGPLRSLTGASKTPRAIQYVTTLCAEMGYECLCAGETLTVTIRNFGRKQHAGYASRGQDPQPPPPSEVRSPKSDSPRSPIPPEPPAGVAPGATGTGHLPGMDPPPRTKRRRREPTPETPPPLEVAPELIQELEDWTKENVPSDVGLAAYHVHACLDYARGRGWSRASWPATFRTWIRKAPEMRDYGPPPVLPKPKTEDERRARQRSAADELRELEEQRVEREVRRNVEIHRHRR